MTDWDQDPEGALARAKEDIVGEIPLMSQPPDVTLTLLRGLWQNGTLHTDAEVKELSGEDEEVVARSMNSDENLGFVNATIAQGLVRIGPVDLRSHPPAERVVVINSLLIGEKEQIFLRILQVTFGDERSIATTCPACKAELDVQFSINDDIKTKTLEDPQRLSYEFKLRDGSILEYRLVTGADQAEATRRKNSTVPEQNTVMLSQCITTVNGKPLVNPLHYARSMNAGDRRKLLEELNDRQPGPYFEGVKLPCAECGVEATFLPSWADLL